MDPVTRVTTDRNMIRDWAEQRKGRPAFVRRKLTNADEPAVPMIDFQDETGDRDFEPVSWEELFQICEQNNMAFLYQDRTADGSPSRYFQFIQRRQAKGLPGSEQMWDQAGRDLDDLRARRQSYERVEPHPWREKLRQYAGSSAGRWSAAAVLAGAAAAVAGIVLGRYLTRDRQEQDRPGSRPPDRCG